jgi:hypothetical protein
MGAIYLYFPMLKGLVLLLKYATYVNKEMNDLLFNIHLTRGMRVVCRVMETQMF